MKIFDLVWVLENNEYCKNEREKDWVRILLGVKSKFVM